MADILYNIFLTTTMNLPQVHEERLPQSDVEFLPMRKMFFK